MVFEAKNELEQYLSSINPVYAKYTECLWAKEVNSAAQLGNASVPVMHACGVENPVHARDIIAQSKATGASKGFATDKTGQKVADLQNHQNMLQLPPTLDGLAAFIFHPPAAKIPVLDAFYTGLVAHNDALNAIIEPASLSGAEVLAALVVSALQSEFEGGDEIVIAGKVDELLYRVWQCMSEFDKDDTFSMIRKRNRADESATLKRKRPDLCITSSRALLFKGEDKTSESQLVTAIQELGTKMSKWGAAFHGKVDYLLCYACAGPILQFCVLPRGSNIPRKLGRELSMASRVGRLHIIAAAVQVYQVIKAQRQHLPNHYFPLGWKQSTSLSSIEYFDGYVQKRIEYSDNAWPKRRKSFMVRVYKACSASPHLIHAKEPPCDSSSSEGATHYVVDLEPVGEPLVSEYGDKKPRNQAELKCLTKCVVSGLQALHKAKYGHTDIRWQNLIQCGHVYRLIDLEFACKLNQEPFTPQGHVRKARPELYSRKWTAECDLILVGDLLQSCGISDLDAQGQELMHAMQAGTMSTTQALQHPWLM